MATSISDDIIEFTMYPFYGTHSSDKRDVNIGSLPVPVLVKGNRDEILSYIPYFVICLKPLIKYHPDFDMSEGKYFVHISKHADEYIKQMKLPNFEYKEIFEEILETATQLNEMYAEYGRKYEIPEITKHLDAIEQCLAKPKNTLSNQDIEHFFNSYCSFVLTYSTPFILSKGLPLLEIIVFFRYFSTVLPCKLKETESQKPTEVTYDFQDLSINILFTTFKRFLITNPDWIYIRYLTNLLLPKTVHNSICDKTNESLDWSLQAHKIVDFFIKNIPNMRRLRLQLTTVKSSDETYTNLINRLYSEPSLQDEVTTLIDSRSPVWSNNWRLLQYPHVLLLKKSRLPCLVAQYVHVAEKIIHSVIKLEENSDLFENEKNNTANMFKASITMRNVLEKICDKPIITAENWDILTQEDAAFFVKLLTALFRDNLLKSISSNKNVTLPKQYKELIKRQ